MRPRIPAGNPLRELERDLIAAIDELRALEEEAKRNGWGDWPKQRRFGVEQALKMIRAFARHYPALRDFPNDVTLDELVHAGIDVCLAPPGCPKETDGR